MKTRILFAVMLLASMCVAVALPPPLQFNPFTTNAAPGYTVLSNALGFPPANSNTSGNAFVARLNGGSTNQYLNTPAMRYPVETNSTIYSDPSGFTFSRGTLNLVGISNQIDGSQLNIFGVSTQAVAIVHMQSPQFNDVSNTFAMDIGVWNTNFGGAYGFGAMIDLYNTNQGVGLVGPDLSISTTGILPGDSGVRNHPIVRIRNKEGRFQLNYFSNDWNTITAPTLVPGLDFDSRKGIVLPVIFNSTNLSVVSGTLAGTGGYNLTGTGTKFGDGIFDEAGYGDMIGWGITVVHIASVSSATSVTSLEPFGGTFSGSNYSIYRGLKIKDVNGSVVGAISADGLYMTKGGNSRGGIAMTGGGANWVMYQLSGGQISFYNISANSVPFILDTVGNLTLGGNYIGSYPTNTANTTDVTTDLVNGAKTVARAQRFSVSVSAYTNATLSAAAVTSLVYSNAATGTITSNSFSIPSGVLAVDTVTNQLVIPDGSPNSVFWLTNGWAVPGTTKVTYK